jgi:hypothetical protein
MWPFDRRKKRSMENLRVAFSQYLSKEVLDALAENPEGLRAPSLCAAKLYYIVLQIRDDELEKVPAYVSQALQTTHAFECVTHIISSVVVVTFGQTIDLMNGKDDESIDRRADLIARLLGDLGTNVRVVSGRADGLLGQLGTAQRFSFGPVIPNFGRALQALTRLEYGHSAEV